MGGRSCVITCGDNRTLYYTVYKFTKFGVQKALVNEICSMFTDCSGTVINYVAGGAGEITVRLGKGFRKGTLTMI